VIRSRLLLWGALSFAGLTSIGTASAQPQKKPPGKLDPKMAEAKRLFDDGADLYMRGNYEEAIDAWQKSYEISKKPLIFESIANAYERLGQPRQARDYLGRWRAAAPPDEHELLDARLKKLDERIAREDAETARKADEEKAKEKLKPAEPVVHPEPPRPPAADPGTDARTIGFVIAGGGIGAVVVGVTLDVVAAARRPDASASCKASGDRQVCTTASKDGIESSNTLALVGDIIWIAGGLAVAGGAVLVLTQGARSDKQPATARIAPVVTPRGGGVAMTGRF